MVKKWFADFKRGSTNTDDAERSGHPNSAVVPENIKEVNIVILANRKFNLREITDTLEISEGSLFTILHEHLNCLILKYLIDINIINVII